jgi:citrate synthase
LGTRGAPFDGMIEAAAALMTSDLRTEPTAEIAKERAPVLLRRLIAAAGLPIGVDAVTSSLETEGAARALVLALGGRTTSRAVAAMNEALILCADHELNASTFTCRVTASAGANLSACTLSALATLSGTFHGGVTARVEAMIDEIDRPERTAAWVAGRLDRGEPIPGFGHPLYPNGDPRGGRLLELAERIGPKTRGVRILSTLVSTMDLATREKPTSDVGLVALTSALGLGIGAPLAVFASGRIAGWIAHALEQRSAGYLLRPRARYVGP